MPKIGMEPIRRKALINATIAEIGQAGSLDVTVGQIARRAGMSSGLAHHYFGGKDQILLAAMRHAPSGIGATPGSGVRRTPPVPTPPHLRCHARTDGANLLRSLCSDAFSTSATKIMFFYLLKTPSGVSPPPRNFFAALVE